MTFLLVPVMLLAAYQVVVAVLVQVGAIRVRRRKSPPTSRPTPSVSLLVPARNEEDRLPALLASLEPQLDALKNAVFVNDRSSDRTGALLDSFAASHPDRVIVIHVNDSTPGPSPKLEAMKAGLTHITGEVLLMTDADCRVPPDWVCRMAGQFRDDTVGLVMAPIVARSNGTLLAQYSLSEHVYRYMGAAGLCGLGIPAGGYGNNMAVRMDTLEEVGGLDAASVSVTEDAALVDLVGDISERRVIALLDSDVMIQTEPVSRWRQMFGQLVRWQVGAVQSPDFISRLGMSLLNLGYLSTLVLVVAGFWNLIWLVGPAGTLVGASIMYVGGGLHLGLPARYWLLLPINFVIMAVINSITGVYAGFDPRITWKGTSIRSARNAGSSP